jgi:AraC family transcriptional regulator, regulatory protein of adaptative response / methylated-DNA-[protein]-cysteine methyltransferase
MRNPASSEKDYRRIEESLLYLHGHLQEQPRLEDLARRVQLSPFHFQKLFKRWAGVSPKAYLAFLTANFAKGRLSQSKSVLDAAYDAGLSSPGRLHDLMVKVEALSPGEIKSGGAGVEITYGFCESPFGLALLGLTRRGICHLGFPSRKNREKALSKLKKRWPQAQVKEDRRQIQKTAREIFKSPRKPLKVLLKGSPFQLKVWEALLQIPRGQTRSYGEVARKIGKPKAGRAVGSAVGANSVGFLIPCHRVIRESGNLGGFSWGLPRKRVMLAWESCGSIREARSEG